METRQRRMPLWSVAANSAIYITIAIIVTVLIAVGLSGWDWSLFPQVFVRLWIAFLAVLGLAVGMSVLIAWKPLKVSFAGLTLLGFLLLFASSKGTLINQYLGGWIYENWDMNLFSTSITVFALAIAIGAIASVRRNN